MKSRWWAAALLGFWASTASAQGTPSAVIGVPPLPSQQSATGADVRDFGVKCDGTTDNLVTLQAAFNWLPNTGGTLRFPGNCIIGVSSGVTIGNGNSTTQSTINQNFVLIGGAGAGTYDDFGVGSAITGSTIKYIGAGAYHGNLLTVLGPIVGSIRNLQLDGGAYKVDYGLYAYNLTHSDEQNISVAHFNVKGIKLDAYPTITSVFIGGNDNDWRNVNVYMQGATIVSTTGNTHTNTTLDGLGTTTGAVAGQLVTGAGIPIGTEVLSVDSSTKVTLTQAATASASVSVKFGPVGLDIGFASTSDPAKTLDVARTHFHTGQILMPVNNGASDIVIRGADLLTFDGVFTYGGANGAVGVTIAPPVNALFLPNSIEFINSPITAGFSISSTWACQTGGGNEGLVFFGMPTGDMIVAGHEPPSGPCVHGFTNNGTWFDQIQPLSRFGGTTIVSSPSTLSRQAPTSVLNSATRTGVWNYTLPANALSSIAPDNGAVTWDRRVDLHCYGAFLNNTGGDQTIGLAVELNGTIEADTGNITVPASAAFGPFDFTIGLHAHGASNLQRLEGMAKIGTAGGSSSTMAAVAANLLNEVSGLTIDATQTITFLMTGQNGIADANLRINFDACDIALR